MCYLYGHALHNLHILSMTTGSDSRRGDKASAASSIGTVERETGLSKDTLRVWERRYGFPQPLRDGHGERLYPADQVEKLMLIRRLMDRGVRPGRIVSATVAELAAQLGPKPATANGASAPAGPLREVLHLLRARRLEEMRQQLEQALLRLGLQRFVLEVAAPLSTLVGEAWAAGEIEIFDEHVYSEQIAQLLRRAMGSETHAWQRPRVLLTTPPGEAHQLGLLMACACIVVEGAQCISLGPQTPIAEIVHAARAHQVDIVGLSFSRAMKPRAAGTLLGELRQQLDPSIALWAGGALWQRRHPPVAGVATIAALTEIPAALAEWREAAAEREKP